MHVDSPIAGAAGIVRAAFCILGPNRNDKPDGESKGEQ